MPHPILYLINIVFEIIVWIVIASAIMSWLVAFGVVNMRNQFIRTIAEMLHRLTEPLLRPIRRMLPNLGGVDISPVVLLVGLYVLRYAINYYFAPNFY
jgi:YggT family protein